MARRNPEKALAALLPLPIKAGKDVVVKPMTLGMWAALERINSPLILTPEEGHKVDTLELLPSLYLLTHDPIEVFRGNILELAMAWADTVPVKTMELIRQAAYRQMGAAFDVIPEPDEKSKKKKTDGFLAYLAQWAAETYHWTIDEILWRVPLATLCLFHRREGLKADKIMPLEVIEEIDHGE